MGFEDCLRIFKGPIFLWTMISISTSPTNWHHDETGFGLSQATTSAPSYPLGWTCYFEATILVDVSVCQIRFWCLDVGWCFFFLNYLLLQRWGYCWLKLCFFFFLSGWLISFQFWGKDSLRYVYIYIYLHMLLYSCLLYDNFSVVWTPSSLYSMCMQNFHLLILCCGDHPWGMQKTPQWRKEYPRSKSGGFGCYNCFHRFVVADSCFSNGEFFQQSSGWKKSIGILGYFWCTQFFWGGEHIKHST